MVEGFIELVWLLLNLLLYKVVPMWRLFCTHLFNFKVWLASPPLLIVPWRQNSGVNQCVVLQLDLAH